MSQLLRFSRWLALLFCQNLPRGVKPLGDGPENKRR
nr:MAG TPA: hypothetical protein [Caudoviricetes sp.]DAX10658.1 MAG TPA: hypothetical protein [Caudoviricetes sp.]